MALEGELIITQVFVRRADIAGKRGERPTVLDRAKNSHCLIKQFEGFELLSYAVIRYAQVVECLSLPGAIACGSQQWQRLDVIVDCGFLVTEVVVYFPDAIEYPAKQLVIACSSSQRQGLSGIRERLLPDSEVDVGERDRIQRRASSFGPRRRANGIAQPQDDGYLQHRFTRRGPRIAAVASATSCAAVCDSCAGPLQAHADERDVVAARRSIRLRCSNAHAIPA